MEKKKLVKQALAALLLVSAVPMSAVADVGGQNVVLAAGGCAGGCNAMGCNAMGCNASTGGTGSASTTTTTSRSKYFGSQNEAGGVMDQEMNRNMTNRVTSKGPTGSYGTSVGSSTSPSSTTGSAPNYRSGSTETTDNTDDSYPTSAPRRY